MNGMGARKEVPTWRVTPVEGDPGKWTLLRAQNFVPAICGRNTDDDQHFRPIPSMAKLMSKGFHASLKKTVDDVSPQRVIAAPQMTSHCIDMLKPRSSEFLSNEQSNKPNEQFFNEKQGVKYDSSVMQINATAPQLPFQMPIKDTERVDTFRKPVRKRAPFKSSFRGVEANYKHCTKSDALQNPMPTGIYSPERLRCKGEVCEPVVMFQTAGGKSVGISSESLKKARAILGEDLCSESPDDAWAGHLQISKSSGMFQGASGNSVSVPSSLNRAQVIFCEDPMLVPEPHGIPLPHTMNETMAIVEENLVTVSLPSSIKGAQSIVCEDSTSGVPESYGRHEPQTMGKALKMSDNAAENHQAVSSSSMVPSLDALESHGRPTSQTMDNSTSMLNAAAGNLVKVSTSSIQKARSSSGEDCTSEVLEQHSGHVPQNINKTASIFRTAAGNPVSLSSISIKRAQAILEGDPYSEDLESNGGPKSQIVNKAAAVLQTDDRNPGTKLPFSIKKAPALFGKDYTPEVLQKNDKVKPQIAIETALPFESIARNSMSVSAPSLKKAKNLLYEYPYLEITGNCKPEIQADNISSATLQTATENCLIASSISFRKANSLLEKDLEKVLNSSPLHELSTNKKNCKSIKENTQTASMFQTATGKPVSVSESSLKRARSILREDGTHGVNEDNHTAGMFQSVTKNPAESSLSAIRRVETVIGKISLEKDDLITSDTGDGKGKQKNHLGYTGQYQFEECIESASMCMDNPIVSINVPGQIVEESEFSIPQTHSHQSLFQTGSGKPVSISIAGISKAKALLEVENIQSSTTTLCENNTDSESNQMHQFMFQTGAGQSVSVSTEAMKRAMNLLGNKANKGATEMHSLSDLKMNTAISTEPPSLLFQTGGGKSVCISNAAMKRASKLLSDGRGKSSATMSSKSLSGVIDSSASYFPPTVKDCKEVASNKENLPYPKLSDAGSLTPLRASMLSSKDTGTRKLGKRKVSMSPLVEISNTSPAYDFGTHSQGPAKAFPVHKSTLGSKKGSVFSRYVSPFKQPRRSEFSSPHDKSVTCAIVEPRLPVQSFPQEAPSEVKFHFSYPSHKKRKTLQEYFGGPPHHQQALWYLSNEIQTMTADAALHYKFQMKSGSGDESLSFQDFWKMLLQSGADPQLATIDWVENHYKWIVWKLACIERSYARQAAGKYLTVQNVFEELKYRYEREVNLGHRSPLRKILEGDASPVYMMILCVSAVRVCPTEEFSDHTPLKGMKEISKEAEHCISNDMQKYSCSRPVKLEITDGWYCLNAILDEALSKQLLAGKLFVGQKLRICGASLHGWVGPLSPLEAFRTVSLVLHINGTYRAHWAERLSFCRGLPIPLAFSCIKEGGGPVPRTFVGVTRIYPTLYMERLANGGYTIRSERAEDKTLHLYNERRAHIVEDIVFKGESDDLSQDSNKDKDEGAKLYSVLENAAEPELIMADMTSAQLAAFATYQSKREAAKKASLEKHIQKALADAGLDSRKVTPFLRLRITGLTRKGMNKTNCKEDARGVLKREGLVTIWQPTVKQVIDLKEGAIYCAYGLVPVVGKSGDNCSHNLIQFQANKSTLWHHIPPSMCKNFEFLYTPRSALLLSDLGKVPLYSEFDIAVLVLHVGEPYSYGKRKRQWLFVSDSSVDLEGSCEQSEILAIDFSSPCDSFIPVDRSLAGFTVGFCNLLKQKQDQNNSLWVAEMTENSLHSLNFNAANFCHLKAAAKSVDKWAKVSLHMVEKLSQRVSGIVRNTM